MSSDHYYVVIVPHADQAAQAIAKERTAGGKHASRREPVFQRVTAGTPAPIRLPAAKSASTREHTGKPVSTREHHAHASSTSRPARSGYVGGNHEHVLRTWSVVVGDDKYDVTDSGGACGYRIECKGITVWLGKLGRRGTYDTDSTTLPAEKLTEVLRLVYVGDQRNAQKHAKHAPHTEEPKSTRRPKPTGSAAPRAPAAPPSETRLMQAKPKGSAAPRHEHAATPATKPRHGHAAAPATKPRTKATAKVAAKPRAKATPAAKPRHEHAATPAAKPRANAKPKAKPQAKPKTTLQSTQAGPQTQRTPVSQPSPNARSHHAPHMDDKSVLKVIKQQLEADDPSKAEKSFKVMKAIWMRGGREATVAWMAKRHYTSMVDAFEDWMSENVDEARAMLDRPPHAAEHEQVA